MVTIDDVLDAISKIRDVGKGYACRVEDLTSQLNALKVFRDYVSGYSIPSDKMDKLNSIIHQLEEYFSILGFGSIYHVYYNNWLNDAIEVLYDIVENHVLPSLIMVEPTPEDFAPPEGWSHVWQFDEEWETTDCFNHYYYNFHWKPGYIYSKTESAGDYAEGRRFFMGKHVTYFAICLKFTEIWFADVGKMVLVLEFISSDASYKEISTTVILKRFEDGDYMVVSDEISGVSHKICLVEKDVWYVFKVTYSPPKIEIFKGKDKVGEATLTVGSIEMLHYYMIDLHGRWDPTAKQDLECSWVALREA